MTRFQALSDVFYALALTLLGAIVAAAFGTLAGDQPELLVVMLQGIVILAGLQLLLRLRGQDWRDLGLPAFSSRDLLRALQALGIMFLVNLALIALVHSLAPSLIGTHQERLAEVGSLLNEGSPFIVIIAAMLFVGFYEEVLARGFLLKRCQQLIGGYWGPVVLSAALFGLGHFYQGILGMLQTTLMGIVFAALVMRWGSLWPLILAHSLINILSLGFMRQLDGQGDGGW